MPEPTKVVATVVRKTVEQYIQEVAKCMKDCFFPTIKKLGCIFADAKKVLPTEEYEDFVGRLHRAYGLTQADLAAAIGVYKGELEEDLFIDGTKCSKVLTLNTQERKRLLSDEKLGLKLFSGRIIHKTWREMTPAERDQLLGPKGGHIHLPSEQRIKPEKGEKKDKGTKSVIGLRGNYEVEDSLFSMKYGNLVVSMTLHNVIADLKRKNQLEDFLQDLKLITDDGNEEGNLVPAN